MLSALGDLAGALVPLAARRTQRDVEQRLSRIPTELNSYGFDPYGLSTDWWRRLFLPVVMLYRYYFRVEVFDIDRIPSGGVLLVSNHAGQLPFDGAMLSTALLLEAEPPRIARPMGEYWIPTLPWIGTAAARTGTLVGTRENCVRMLTAGECVMVFPEGVHGMNKVYSRRYELQRFGLGFMRLALETSTPIVPVAIVGSEEQQPGFANLDRLGRMLGMPALPITLGFPWLGPMGLLPLPVKYRIHFGEPLQFDGDPSDEDTEIEAKVGRVTAAIQDLLDEGVRTRRGVFT